MNENKAGDVSKVCLWGTTVSEKDATKIGLGAIFGFLGLFLLAIVFGPQNKIIAFSMALAFSAIEYFGVAKLVYKDKRKT